MTSRASGPLHRSLIRALLGLTMAAVFGLWAASPAAALEQPDTIDLETLDMVPERMWGVSGQNPSQTQTETLDVLVYDFAQSGDYMFVGGAFLNVQEGKRTTPIPQAYVAAFDIHTGDWVDTWQPTIDRAVYALDVLPNGSLLVGGEFENVNGQSRRGLVALDPLTGAIDPSFAGAVDRPWSSRRATVRDMKVEVGSGLIYVAGNFSHLDGAGGSRTQVSKAGRFANAAGVLDASWKPQVGGGAVWGLDTNPALGEVALSGFFTSIGAQANTGHFQVVDDTSGAPVGGKIELPRNYTFSQLEVWDVAYGDGTIFAIGEQHILQVLRASDHQMLGYHHTGNANNGFQYTSGFAGGAYQAGEKIGDILFAGCHCTFAQDNHYESFTGRRTTRRNVMAYDAATGRHLEEFNADIQSPRDGFWAAASSTNGCLYLGGDFHVGGTQAGQERWLGGFAKLCSPKPTNSVTDPGPQTNLAGDQVSLQIEASGRADLTLTYEADGLPDGLTIDADTGLISGSPTTVEAETVTITVGDEDDLANPASVTFDWVVLGAGPPVLQPIGSSTVVETDPITIAVVANDPGGLTYEAAGLPAGLSIDADSGLISGAATPDGVFDITVTATDPLDRSDTENFTLTVLNWDRVAAIESYVGYTQAAGDYFVGWQFSVDQPMTISELGVHDANRDGTISNQGSTAVGLYDNATQQLLAQVDVPAGAPVESGFAYASLANPITVMPGNTYVIGAESSGEDYALYGTIDFGAGINYAGYAYKVGAAIGWPNYQGPAGPYYFGPTFRAGGDRPDPGGGGGGGGGGGATLLDAGSVWRYDDSGSDLGTQWRTVGFDDGAWPQGQAEFGFGDGDEATELTAGSTTYYARTTFQFSGDRPASLDLDLKADDGAVVYLNGTEILRDNMPVGTIRFNTAASGWRAGRDEGFQPHVAAAAALVEGTNVVAVEIHNVWSGNNDLSFDLELERSDQPPGPDPDPELVAIGASWNHDDSANGAPANWKQGLPGAQNGDAEFGFGDGDEATELVPGQEAYYFTREFTVADPAAYTSLELGLVADDGAVVYLNGTEVHRVNMPVGPIDFDTRPLTWTAGTDELLQEYTIGAEALVAGTNTIAVEVHNLWPGNSDLSFDLSLR